MRLEKRSTEFWLRYIISAWNIPKEPVTRLHFHQNHPRLRIKIKKLRKKLLPLLRAFGFPIANATFVFTTNTVIRELHRQYLRDKTPTDVLTFPVPNGVEVVVSLDQARQQAAARRVSLDQEVLLLTLHGLLHRFGYNDLIFSDWCNMKQEEFRCLAKLL